MIQTMARFIEVHDDGKEILINVDHIREVREREDGLCDIYYSGETVGDYDEDYICPDESYERVKYMIYDA